MCVGDGDRGSRHSLYQSVLHVTVAQTESRRGVKDPAGNGHCPRYEQTHMIQSSYFKGIISSSLCHFQPVLHKKKNVEESFHNTFAFTKRLQKKVLHDVLSEFD